MREKMPVICPTSQANRLRHVGTTGKSGAAGEKLSSEQQLLRTFIRHSRARVSASPESIAPHECWEEWIPGSHLAVRPGMTAVVKPSR